MVASAQGLDVSNFQGQFDWAGAVAKIPGLCFGIFRLTQGLGQSGTNSPDPDSVWNAAQITKLNLHRGAYHFLDPFQGGAAQAKYFVSMCDKLGLTNSDMLWCDNETAGTSPASTSQCCDDFMTELIRLRPQNPRGVYTFINFAKEGYCSGAGKYPLWLAYPNATAPVAPPPWVNWTFWQWGTRNGIDADAFNGTSTELDAWIASFQGGGAGFTHQTVAGDTIGSLAKSRGMDVWAWLRLQRKLSDPNATHLVRHSACEPGSTWRSVKP